MANNERSQGESDSPERASKQYKALTPEMIELRDELVNSLLEAGRNPKARRKARDFHKKVTHISNEDLYKEFTI